MGIAEQKVHLTPGSTVARAQVALIVGRTKRSFGTVYSGIVGKSFRTKCSRSYQKTAKEVWVWFPHR